MSAYIEPIRTAVLFFPFIALMLSVPFVLVEYHKFGSVSVWKSIVLYSFVLYFLCAYFLVILPLPDRAAVAAAPAPKLCLIPFQFVADFLRENPASITQPGTWLAGLKDSTVLQPVFNLFLTLPFGVYLRYYFHVDKKRVLLYTFLLSLFFELTQLTGLYGIYAHAYRFFDVDDLMINTLGGFLGWLCAPPVMKVLPSREMLEARSRVKGRKVSGLRRTTALVLDLVLCSGVIALAEYLLRGAGVSGWIALIVFFLYYIVVPSLWNGSTLGERFLNLRIENQSDRSLFLALCARTGMFLLTYVVLPVGAGMVLAVGGIFLAPLTPYFYALCLAAVLAYYLCVGIKYLFTDRPMYYEKTTKTTMVSTISATAELPAAAGAAKN